MFQIQFSIRIDILNGILFFKVIQNLNHLHTLLLNLQTLKNHFSGQILIIIILDYSTYSQEQQRFSLDGVDSKPWQDSIQEREYSELEKIIDIQKRHANKQLLLIPYSSLQKRRHHQLLIPPYQKINQLKMLL